VPAGTTNCAAIGGGTYVTNPISQLKGVWTDMTPVPSDIVALGLTENLVDDPIVMEAMRASAHFNYDPQATYIVLTPRRFGHGVFDGYSIVVGHEYAEAVTNPDNFAAVQDGWNDAQTSETGDKCAWTNLANVAMNKNTKFGCNHCGATRLSMPLARGACCRRRNS
jgi:hypothetical protein